ncbi:MAG: NlpC/P60 family protein [Bacteroidota bacterium]|nr:NlpC/P60 family protein [Bacteroidota bacterium]
MYRFTCVPIVLICVVCLAGCYSPQSLVTTSETVSTTSAVPSAAIESELRTLATSWQGTPHLEGGSSQSGIDAPGLVLVIADQILGISLPHSTARQLGFGEEISRSSLMPGDIVFFRPTSMPRHVGVYLGSREFVHSWPNDGVSIARLDDPYWNGAYWAARRISGEPLVSAPVTPEEQPSRPTRRRVGW